ncbi:MAG: hypothetical protein ACTSR3_11640 [Candidatus Helarchaeota archaeon]
MISKENAQKIFLYKSKKSQIKYIILLLISGWLVFFFLLSIYNFFNKSIYLGNSFTDILTQLAFLIFGNIIFIFFVMLAIYGSLKSIFKSKKILFDKKNEEAIFYSREGLFKGVSLKKIPFSEFSKIKVEQEQDSDYVLLSIEQNNNAVPIDSDYGEKGMERLNNLAESIQKMLEIPLSKGTFEDIYAIEEECKEQEGIQNKNG